MDDVGATVLVNGDLATRLHLFHPVDCHLSLDDLFLPSHYLLLKLLNFDMLLFDFRAQTFPVKAGSSLYVELLGRVDLSSASLRARLEEVYGPTVCSYIIKRVRKERNYVYLLLIMVEA